VLPDLGNLIDKAREHLLPLKYILITHVVGMALAGVGGWYCPKPGQRAF